MGTIRFTPYSCGIKARKSSEIAKSCLIRFAGFLFFGGKSVGYCRQKNFIYAKLKENHLGCKRLGGYKNLFLVWLVAKTLILPAKQRVGFYLCLEKLKKN